MFRPDAANGQNLGNANGHANGRTNGNANGHANGNAAPDPDYFELDFEELESDHDLDGKKVGGFY